MLTAKRLARLRSVQEAIHKVGQNELLRLRRAADNERGQWTELLLGLSADSMRALPEVTQAVSNIGRSTARKRDAENAVEKCALLVRNQAILLRQYEGLHEAAERRETEEGKRSR